jgi:hypothetical protein
MWVTFDNRPTQVLTSFQGASVPAAPTLAAAESEAAEAAAAPPVAEVELTAEQEDLLASFLSDVTQVLPPPAYRAPRPAPLRFAASAQSSLGTTKAGSRARLPPEP